MSGENVYEMTRLGRPSGIAEKNPCTYGSGNVEL